MRHFNFRHKRVGALWQGRYKAIMVQDAGYLLECSRYIHLNPNRTTITKPAKSLFSDSARARRRRLQLFALQKHSKLRPTEIARRYQRRHSAVTMAVKELETDAEHNSDFRARLVSIEKMIPHENEK